MRVLVTGMPGFIANHLYSRLEVDGHSVTGISRHVGEDFQGDLRDMSFCEHVINRLQPEAVFHLAAQAIVPEARRNPWGTFEDNVRGTYNLLEAISRYAPEAVTVVASSDKAYGEAPIDRGYDEDDPLVGRGPYDCSKACADLIAHSYALEMKMRVAVVRAGNVYGPGDLHPTRLIPSLIDDLLSDRQPRIQSDGTPVRDYLYVTDAADAYVAVCRYLHALDDGRVAEGRFHTAFNFAGGEPISVLDVCARLTSLYDEMFGEVPYDEPMLLGNRVGEISHQELNTELARSVLGWEPRTSLNDGLRVTMLARAMQLGKIVLKERS